ncbi:MAG: YfhO family protein [Chloroflexota bacterium]
MRLSRCSPHVLIIMALPLLLFWRWIFKGEVLYWGTLLFQFWPWHQLVKNSLLAGEWPLWNPLLGNGAPLLANLQSAVFYPPNLLYLFVPVEHGLTLSILLHLILAGGSMYGYARRLGLLPLAATVSALTFMFSGYLIGRTQFVPMVNAAAWIPVNLFLYEELVGTPLFSRRGGLKVGGLGLSLALPLLAGHAQLWFYSLWLMGVYALVRGWQAGQANRRWPGLAQAGGRLGMALALALLVAAVQLLPTAEFALQSARRGGAERAFALTYSFWPWRLVTLLAPDFFGHPAYHNYWGYANYWEDHAYVGVLPLLLALAALWSWGRSKLSKAKSTVSAASDSAYWRVIPFFGSLIPVSLVLAMGWNTPVYGWVFDQVPGFGYFQAPARLLIWYTVASAVLAGSGAQIFESIPLYRPFWRRLLAVGVSITVAGLAGRALVSGRSETFLAASAMFGLWLVLSVGLLLARPEPAIPAGRPWRKLLWRGSVIVLVAVNLLWAAWPLLPMLPSTLFNRPLASAGLLQAQSGHYRFWVNQAFDYRLKFSQYYRFDTFGPSEVEHWQPLRETLAPNLGVYAALPTANNDDPLVVRHWRQFTDLLKTADPTRQARLLGLMNVRYVIDAPGQAIGAAIYQADGWAIYRLPEARPRAYFVPTAYPARDEAEAVVRLTAPDFDSQQEVVIINSEPEAGWPTGPGQVVDFPPVRVEAERADRVSLTVEAPGPGFVVLTDTFYPGWQASVDGQPARIYRANLAFRALAVEAGTHHLVFNYRPRSLMIGLWISAMTGLGLVAGLFSSKKLMRLTSH